MPDTDKELLERAARAAGIEIWRWNEFTGKPVIKRDGVPVYWSPLTDDGDALRLLVAVSVRHKALRLMLPEMNDEWAVIDDYTSDFKVREYIETDPNAATRRCIVRAAASLCQGGEG